MVLLALAATALHAIRLAGATLPDLVVGHGVMGRLAARLTVALGGQPMVWETHADRRLDGEGYLTRDPPTARVSSSTAFWMPAVLGPARPLGQQPLAGWSDHPTRASTASP